MAAPFRALQRYDTPFEGYDAAQAFAVRNARQTGQRQRVTLRTVASRAGRPYRRWIVTLGRNF